MSTEVVVQQKLGQWSLMLHFVGPLLIAVGGVMLATGNGFIGVGVLAIGVISAVLLTVGCWIYNRRYRTITDTGTGFIVSDAAGDRMFDDSDVEALAYGIVPAFRDRMLVGDTRHFQVWVHQEPGPIGMQNVVKGGGSDPLFDLIERLAQSQYDEAIEALATGGVISGVGWQLSAQALTFDSQIESVPVREIMAVARFEARLCLWRTDEPAAFARLAISARSAWLLEKVLSSWIEDREKDNGAPASSHGLGRLLFQRESSNAAVVGTVVLGLVCLLVGGMLLVLLPDKTIAIITIPFAVAAIGCFVAAYGFFRTSVRIYEMGLCKQGWFGESKLLYSDLAALTDESTLYYADGNYSRTLINMTFEPKPGVETAETIILNTMLQDLGDDFFRLRDHISALIADQMAEEIKATGSTRWTTSTTFLKEGIEHCRAGVAIGKQDAFFVPWEQFRGFVVVQNILYMYQEGSAVPFGQENTSVRNYYPGRYHLAINGYQVDVRLAEDEGIEPKSLPSDTRK